ncbi:nucleotidyltransferase family protein [Vulcanisaeta sp. JCM 16161]
MPQVNGRRFGGNKLLVKIGGEPVILRVLKALNEFERVVIVGAYANELMPYLSNEIVIYNPHYRDGMSTSIRLGLRFFQDYDAVLVVLADMPLITNEVVSRIVGAYRDGCSAVAPMHNGVRGNPVLIHRALFPELMRLSGDVGAREILRGRADVCVVECGPEVLIDIDTVNDLARVLNMVNTNSQ